MPMSPIGGQLDFPSGPLAQPLQMAPPTPKKGGMFGSGKPDWGMAIQAALNGFLAARGNPVGMMGLQAMQLQRQQALEDKKYQSRREDQFQDYVRREAWDIANKPQGQGAPHYFESNTGDQYAIGPDGQPKLVFKDPFQYKLVPNGLGGVVPVNLQALMGQQGAPQAPVGKLTPIDEGGPTLGGSGGFPRPY